MIPNIDVSIESPEWEGFEALTEFVEKVIETAVEDCGRQLTEKAEISIVLCSDSFIEDLNRKWRGIAQPTNVLSFPMAGDPTTQPLLGDIVIAFGTAQHEAAAAGNPLRDHVAHLLVHGFLHLIGHDHQEIAEAEAMEALERTILGHLGIADPYAAPSLKETVGAHERA